MVTADLAAPDPSVLESAVHGADAVLSGLGPRSAADAGITAPGTEAVIRAMQATGVRRVVVVSASGAFIEESDDLVTRRLVKPLLGVVLRESFADTTTMEAVIRASGLDWTIVRPPRLTDGPHTGRYRTGQHGVRRGYTVARADVADCLLSLVDRSESVGRTITVAR